MQMRKHRASLRRRFVIAALLVAAASRARASFAGPLDRILAQFSWAGTYDVVGSGFPDGDRWAVVRPRVDVEALIAADRVPEWLRGCADASSS